MKLFKFWKKSSEKKNKEPTKKLAKKAAKAAKRQAKKAAKAAKCHTDPQQCECERCKELRLEGNDLESQIYLYEKHREDKRNKNRRLQQELLSFTMDTRNSLNSFSEGQQLQNSRVSELVQHFEQWTQQIDGANSSESESSTTSDNDPEQQAPQTSEADSNPPVQPSKQNQIVQPIVIQPQPAQAPVAAPTSPILAAPVPTAAYNDPCYLYYYYRYYQYMGTDPDITTQQCTYPNTTGQQYMYTALDNTSQQVNMYTGRNYTAQQYMYTAQDIVNTAQQLNMYTSQEYTGQQVGTNPTAYEELLLGRSLMNELSGDSSTTTNEAPDTNANEQPDIGRSCLSTCMNETMQHPQHQLRQAATNEYGGAQHHEQLPATLNTAHLNHEVYGGSLTYDGSYYETLCKLNTDSEW